MLSFLHPTIARTTQAHLNPTIYSDGSITNEFNKNGYVTTQTLPPCKSKSSPSPFYPPPHRHTQQAEYFEVLSGTGRWHLFDTKTFVDLKAGNKISIEKWQPHVFENLSVEDPLVIGAKYDAGRWNRGEQERFFRNTLGYIDDCLKAKVSPSPFQLCLFLYEADMPIAVSPGSEWSAKWSDWDFTFVMGKCVGQWVLGYQGSYPEYFQSPSIKDE